MSISTVTSEALQLKLRQLLPSQQGFGTDLSASDTIIPVVDLTAAAEGSDVPEILQQALAFGSQTSFNSNGATTTIVNTAGFYLITGAWSIDGRPASSQNVTFQLDDGATQKIIYRYLKRTTTDLDVFLTNDFSFVIFLRTGDKLDVVTTSNSNVLGSSRQIADVNGVLVQPSGFTPQ